MKDYQAIFFIIYNSCVYTAPLNSVLNGTILKIVIKICEQHQITIKYEHPKCNETQYWEAAFITSTSRLVLPIHELRIGSNLIKLATDNLILRNIMKFVVEDLKMSSVNVYP